MAETAERALREALQGAERPLDAAGALRCIGGRFRPEHRSTWDAFRLMASKALAPNGAAKDIAWAVLDADYGRLADTPRAAPFDPFVAPIFEEDQENDGATSDR